MIHKKTYYDCKKFDNGIVDVEWYIKIEEIDKKAEKGVRGRRKKCGWGNPRRQRIGNPITKPKDKAILHQLSTRFSSKGPSMASLHCSPSVQNSLFVNSLPQVHIFFKIIPILSPLFSPSPVLINDHFFFFFRSQKLHGRFVCCRAGVSFLVRAEQAHGSSINGHAYSSEGQFTELRWKIRCHLN